MTLSDLRSKISVLASDLIPLAEAHPCEDKATELLNIMEGTLRKNIMRLQAVNLLCDEEKLAGPAFEITRNIVEDAVSIEYLLTEDDPEKAAHKFYEFRWIQLKEDLEYYKLVNTPINSDDFPGTEANIEKEYDRVIKAYSKDFLNTNGKPVRSWPRRDVEMMLSRLEKRKALSPDQIRMIARTYVNGCRKTHFNPVELLLHMNQEAWDASSQEAQKLALIVSSSLLARLSTRYIDLISQLNCEETYHDIGTKANSFMDELNSATDVTL